jgi:alkaline phosphatase
MHRLAVSVLAASTLCACATASPQRPAPDQHRPHARNLILFIGDGMGVTTVTAARILEGQLRGEPGEENLLSFERFEHLALAKTYSVNQQTSESAAAATAMLTGVKTRARMINLGPGHVPGSCTGSDDHGLATLAEIARAAGLATGVVTTTRVTHATPAAVYARSANRDWETDSAMTAAARAAGCADIARQLLEPADGRGLDVVMGGGRAAFLPEAAADPEYPQQRGARADGVDLIGRWQASGGRYAWNLAQFQALQPADPGAVLALFEPSHMRYELDRGDDVAGEPSLAQMAVKAIDLLEARGDGYLLVVEAGRIDHAHHDNNAARALHDTLALARAVAAVRERAGADSLIVVTADHSHVFTMAGYPTRGNPILGLVRGNDARGEPGDYSRDLLGERYPTLGYGNGPGYTGASNLQPEGYKRFPHQPASFQGATRTRGDLDPARARAADFIQASLVPLASETHGGEDVPVYATGPGAAAVHGVIEQHLLFRLLAQAQPALRAAVCSRSACPDAAGSAWGGVPHRPAR